MFPYRLNRLEPSQIQPLPTKPVETKPSQTQPAPTKPVETNPSQTNPPQLPPVETKPEEEDDAPIKTEPTVPPTTQPPTTTVPPVPEVLLSFEEYLALTPAEQQAYFESFSNPADYITWYMEAEAAYNESKGDVEIEGGGSIDIGDIIGGMN